jgi:hypothetical protein
MNSSPNGFSLDKAYFPIAIGTSTWTVFGGRQSLLLQL